MRASLTLVRSQSKQKQKVVSLIEKKKSQGIEIVLKSTKLPVAEVVAAIASLDREKVRLPLLYVTRDSVLYAESKCMWVYRWGPSWCNRSCSCFPVRGSAICCWRTRHRCWATPRRALPRCAAARPALPCPALPPACRRPAAGLPSCSSQPIPYTNLQWAVLSARQAAFVRSA
jgi:hypothetical protein